MSLDYPDVYMCLPAPFVATYSSGTNRLYMGAGFGDKDWDEFAAEETCDLAEHRGSFIKVDPLAMKPFASDTTRASYVAADDPGSCPAKKPKKNQNSATVPEDSGSRMRIGCTASLTDAECDSAFFGEIDSQSGSTDTDGCSGVDCGHPLLADTCSDTAAPGTGYTCLCQSEADACGGDSDCSDLLDAVPMDEVACAANVPCQALAQCRESQSGRRRAQVATGRSMAFDADATKLAQLMPSETYEPLCLKYEMKAGSKQYYDERRKYFLAMQQGIDTVDPAGPYYIMYLTEAGTRPYHCNNKEKDGNERCSINATTVYFPGFPSVSIAMLSVEYVKDLREDSEAAFVPTYQYNMWNKMSILSEPVEESCTETATTSIQADADACNAVTDLGTSAACLRVQLDGSSDGNSPACTYQVYQAAGTTAFKRGVTGFQYGAPRRTIPSIFAANPKP